MVNDIIKHVSFALILKNNYKSNIGVMMNEKDGNTTRKRKNIYNGKTT